MPVLVYLHALLGVFLLLAVPALALVGLWGFLRPLPPRFYAGLRGVAWVAILQVVLGFLLFFLGLRPKEGLHLLYGLLLAAGLHYLGGLEPGGWFHRGLKDPPKRPELFVALGLLFALGLVLRVYFTGR
ncbi:hypothetical protein TCCBUS3UF1_4340 [Thermus sp. CCB_US3_UF1]|uniref:hypothetical protein n=1 Tax=Thermus sp. CCB_US3_UF1 TaxID=1111069 RepID=UPI0002389D92|nr:hypothetical protein [Thermus sp. CCB_US3_UF1]AEV15482.1 hypothetical protein TCCBUS3UF1_4340 [Thermus sp. CCB_US3_UF1]